MVDNKRTYEKTHPWITFRIDLRKAQPKLWMRLGEAVSKIEHISGVPLSKNTAEALHRLYLAKGAAATTAIEGNTLSEQEVLQHLEGTLEVQPSKQYLIQEIDNIVKACNSIRTTVHAEKAALDFPTICIFNQQVLHNLNVGDGVVPGKVRSHSVVVGNVYRGAPAEDCHYLTNRLCEWLAGSDFVPPPGMEMVYALLKAVIAHLYLAWIHPFGDGNGRTARLVEFQVLLAAGVPTPAAHLLSNHYNQTRSEYYRQLEYASKSGGEVLPFIEYAIQGLVDGLHEQLARVRAQQWSIAWRDYVNMKFHDRVGATAQRQRELILALSGSPKPVPVGKIAELSPRLARAYATKTVKTISRDVRELERMELLEHVSRTVRARRETILAFLPWRRPVQ